MEERSGYWHCGDEIDEGVLNTDQIRHRNHWIKNSAVEDSPRLLVHFMIEPHYQLVIVSLCIGHSSVLSYGSLDPKMLGDKLLDSLILCYEYLLFIYNNNNNQ